MKKFFLLSIGLLFFSIQSVRADNCFSVNGVQFEKIGYATLLIVVDGKNWGTLEADSAVPDGRLEFRFFTPTLCDGTQNDKFHINGKLFTVRYGTIKRFK